MIALWQAIVLGIVEGLTEFLPVSSTGHLTIAEQLMNIPIEGAGPTAFTAIIQVGAIIAAIIYFWRDIWRVIVGFFRGLFSAQARQEEDWRLAIFVIIGSIPIAVVGLAAKHVIENQLRSLWVVAAALILWSFVMIFAEHAATQTKGENGLQDPRRDLHRLLPGHRADPRRLPLRRHDQRRPAARPRPGHRDPDVVPARHPR